MTKKHQEEADTSAEIERLAEWMRTFNEFYFVRARYPEVEKAAVEGVRRAVSEGNVRGLRMAVRDSIEMAADLSAEDRSAIHELLLDRTGMGLRDVVQEVRRAVRSILRRGVIESDDEYRMLLGRAEQIYDEASGREELRKINALLGQYKQDHGG